MLGYAVSASAITGVLNGCKAELTTDWEPLFLSTEQANALQTVTESIIPATNTPGANDVGVHQFIDLMLKECLNENEQKIMVDGLTQLDSDCRSAYNKAFSQCDNKQQTELLTRYDQAAYQFNQSAADDADKPFFTLLKELTILGYFTSEKIGEEVLSYDPIPDTYSGCIPWEEGKANWSL